MNGDPDGPDEQGTGNDPEESGGPETLIDVLTGADVRATPKNRLVQQVLRQLIETYGFDRGDIRADYHPTTKGNRQQKVDVIILRRGQEAVDEHVERVIVCQTQKPREKLRSPRDAAADLRKLHGKLDLFPDCHLGMWTNGHEEFFVRVAETTFETRYVDIGAWPAPGERTEGVLREPAARDTDRAGTAHHRQNWRLDRRGTGPSAGRKTPPGRAAYVQRRHGRTREHGRLGTSSGIGHSHREENRVRAVGPKA